MNLIKDFFEKGGPAMWPLLVLSILSVSIILERLWFWATTLTKEREIVNRVLEAASHDWQAARDIAKRATNKPIGRFLYAPLRLNQPDPEVFRLALEASADDELGAMRRGDKILEAIVALSPLLGLFGTVWGLINSLLSISKSQLGVAPTDADPTSGIGRALTDASLGIGEALISTASGLIVAITTLAFFRLFQVFLFNQIKIFRKSGNELELLYRMAWSGNDNGYAVNKNSNSGMSKPSVDNPSTIENQAE